MNENRCRYPTALTGGPELGKHQIRRGLVAWFTQTESMGGHALLLAPTEADLDRIDLRTPEVTPCDFPSSTWANWPGEWRGGPVLALWPSQQHAG